MSVHSSNHSHSIHEHSVPSFYHHYGDKLRIHIDHKDKHYLHTKRLSNINNLLHSFHLIDYSSIKNKTRIRVHSPLICPPPPRATTTINYSW
jgi:hypothetical protein